MCLTLAMQQTTWQLGRYSLKRGNEIKPRDTRKSPSARVLFSSFAIYLFICLYLIYLCHTDEPEYTEFKQLQSTFMYEGNSENNLLIQKEEEYNFHDSIVINPIQLNPTHFKSNQNFKTKHLNSISKGGLGAYQSYSLSSLLSRGLNEQQNLINIGLDPKNQEQWRNGNVVQVVSIDAGSYVCQINSKFVELMNKYASMDVCFITVIGDKQVGKSFFCDKLLNLAEIRGSNFCQKQQPGIYTYSVPFLKDGLYIFLLEIARCSIKSELFNRMNVITMMLSSSYILVGDLEEQKALKTISHFKKNLYQFPNLFSKKLKQTLPSYLQIPNLYFLNRSQKADNFQQTFSSDPYKQFKSIECKYLPDGMAAGYKGSKSDLIAHPFHDKQCISPAYLKQISSIFKVVYNEIRQKKYEDLVLTGDITNKLMQLLMIEINGHFLIEPHYMMEKILTDLYISAYNYCVVGYHDELEQYFDDEQPKNSDEMYEVFEKAANNALEKFDEFRLKQELHKKYQQKLLEHIQSKEQLLCKINKQKSKQILMEGFNKIRAHDNDFRSVISKIKEYRKELNQGRDECYKIILSQLYKNGKGENPALVKKFNQLSSEKQRLITELDKVEKNNQKLKEEERQKQLSMDKLNEDEKNFQKEISHIEQKLMEMSKMDAAGLEKIQKQIQVLREKKKESDKKLADYQKENNDVAIQQIRQNYGSKIQAVIQRQKQIQKQLQQIERNNPESKSPVKPVKPTQQGNQKMKTSEVKKQGKQANKKNEAKPKAAK